MSNRRKTIMILSIIILLIIGTFLSIQIFYNRSTKEKIAAKDFVELLYSNNMVDKTEIEDKIKYKSEKLGDGVKEYYRVSTKNYGIDLDSNYKIIGFNNYKVVSLGTLISEDAARTIAEKYISQLAVEDYKFKDTIKEAESVVPYYSYIFTRYKEGYPFYSDQIIINIDKSSGYLSGYSNTTLQGETRSINISIEQNIAENMAVDEFDKLNKAGVAETESTFKAFCNDKDKTETELCYVVTVKGTDIDGKEVKWKYFISTESGEVINSIKDNVSNTIA